MHSIQNLIGKKTTLSFTISFIFNPKYTFSWMNQKQHNRNMQDLVEELKHRGAITTKEIEQAILAVDRLDFIQSDPYTDRPQSIGYNVTISAPHMHAFSLQYLQKQLTTGKPCKVLDVGCGTGYLCPAFLMMIPPAARNNSIVVGIDHIRELVQLSDHNIRKSYDAALNQQKIVLITGDGREGYPQLGPYDAIHVGAAADKIPKALLEQLNFGGRMLIPVGKQGGDQEFLAIDKDEKGNLTSKKLLGVCYVPLTSVENQLKNH